MIGESGLWHRKAHPVHDSVTGLPILCLRWPKRISLGAIPGSEMRCTTSASPRIATGLRGFSMTSTTPNDNNSLSRKDVFFAVIVFLTAFAIRLAYVIEIKLNSPFFYNPIVDSMTYHRWAKDALSNSFWGEDAFWQPPGYPYFLFLLYSIFNVNLLIPRIVQSLIGSLSAVMLYFISRNFINRPQSLIAGAIMAIFAPIIFFENRLLPFIIILESIK